MLSQLEQFRLEELIRAMVSRRGSIVGVTSRCNGSGGCPGFGCQIMVGDFLFLGLQA